MSSNFEERENKLRLLRVWQKKNSIPFIVNTIKDEDPVVRAEAIIILGNLGDEDLASHVIPCLKDKDEHVKYCAIQALSCIKADYIAEHIINATESSSDFVTCRAISVLGALHNVKSLKFLIEMLLDSSDLINKEAAEALERMVTYEPCQDALSKLFEDDVFLQEKFANLYQMVKRRIKLRNIF